MFKIWAKIMKEGKIVRQFVYEGQEKLTYSHMLTYLSTSAASWTASRETSSNTARTNRTRSNRRRGSAPADSSDTR